MGRRSRKNSYALSNEGSEQHSGGGAAWGERPAAKPNRMAAKPNAEVLELEELEKEDDVIWSSSRPRTQKDFEELVVAIKRGDESKIRSHLHARPELIEMRTDYGDTPAHVAAKCERSPCVALLLEFKADPLSRDQNYDVSCDTAWPEEGGRSSQNSFFKDDWGLDKRSDRHGNLGKTVIYYLRLSKMFDETMRLLFPLSRAALVKAIYQEIERKNAAMTPGMVVAAQKGLADLVSLFLDFSCQVLDRAGDGRKMRVQVMPGHTGVVECLSLKGAALFAATASNRLPVVELLLKRRAVVKSDLEARDGLGRSPMHCAVSLGHAKIVQALCQYRAEVDNSDLEKRTPLIEAAYLGFPDVAKVLIEAKADLTHTAVDNRFFQLEARTARETAALRVRGGVGTYGKSTPGHGHVLRVLEQAEAEERAEKEAHQEKRKAMNDQKFWEKLMGVEVPAM